MKLKADGKTKRSKRSCTLDHLFDRHDPRRHTRPEQQERRVVAACKECNEKRGVESNRQAQERSKLL